MELDGHGPDPTSPGAVRPPAAPGRSASSATEQAEVEDRGDEGADRRRDRRGEGAEDDPQERAVGDAGGDRAEDDAADDGDQEGDDDRPRRPASRCRGPARASGRRRRTPRISRPRSPARSRPRSSAGTGRGRSGGRSPMPIAEPGEDAGPDQRQRRRASPSRTARRPRSRGGRPGRRGPGHDHPLVERAGDDADHERERAAGPGCEPAMPLTIATTRKSQKATGSSTPAWAP